MKILIVGAQGMLGQELAKVFADYDLTLWDKTQLDITDSEMVEARLTELKPDLVINSAAYNDVDACEEKFDIAKAINFHGPVNLAKTCQKIGAKVVHYSTDYVFRGDKKEGYPETYTPEPVSKYGASKLLGERVLENCDQCYVMRTSRLFGLPASSEGAKRSFIDVMITLAETRDEIDVVSEEYSNPTYVVDLATQTKVLVDGDFGSGIYHGINEGACTWYEFAEEIFSQVGKEIKLNPVPASKFPRPAKRPDYSSLINTKLPKLRTWQDAISAYLIQKNQG